MKTVKECRAAISDLISEAVPEDDAGRREGLLTLADGWIELIERRGAADAPPPRSSACNPAD
ncbi:hypothetical protein [Brevundimonas sp.]|uniref:hypothetical protein n=1 Tax=Brevundimonas sp. TaxID=1871086 RepID=UPI001A297473|nr:hypothetical protein [Brevundimonas sp.]MBJ7485004.1 hypothetical protein [Brevundimonas sp.]